MIVTYIINKSKEERKGGEEEWKLRKTSQQNPKQKRGRNDSWNWQKKNLLQESNSLVAQKKQ